MRKIVVEVPSRCTINCPLVPTIDIEDGEWQIKCIYRDKPVKWGAKPVKACRDAEVSHD